MMTNKEYKDTMLGTLMYALVGILFGRFGLITPMIIFGVIAILRVSPILLEGFKSENKNEDKG